MKRTRAILSVGNVFKTAASAIVAQSFFCHNRKTWDRARKETGNEEKENAEERN